MAGVQQRTLEKLLRTSEEVSQHVRLSDKRFELVSRNCEARRGQLALLQQDLQYISQALRRLQRLCDSQTEQRPEPPADQAV